MHRIELGTLIEPPERPLLLRLLLFDYLYERVPDGKRDARLVGWLEDAKRSGAFPYKTLVHNTENFFALGVAAILWDRDPPEARVVRAKLRETLPDFYAWVVAAFYPAGEPAH